MLAILRKNGTLKTPVKAYNSHRSEFLIYRCDFSEAPKWEDIFAERIGLFHVKPQKIEGIIEDLNYSLEEEGFSEEYVLVGVLL